MQPDSTEIRKLVPQFGFYSIVRFYSYLPSPLPFSSAICQRSTFSEMVYGLKYVYLLRVLFKAAHIRGTLSDQKTYINPPRLPPDRFFFSSTHSLQFFILFILFNTEVDSRWIPYSVDQTQSHTNYSYISLYCIFLHSK
jgi:hypothetical protein